MQITFLTSMKGDNQMSKQTGNTKEDLDYPTFAKEHYGEPSEEVADRKHKTIGFYSKSKKGQTKFNTGKPRS